MGIILGFGSTEVEVRHRIKVELRQAKDVKEVEKRWKEQAEIYDKMSYEEAPERYTYFFLYGGKIHFHHINRRHPFSPDGWALWQVEEAFPSLTPNSPAEKEEG